jgi:sulfite reductase (NADPH) flavoprotein alpha-component
MPDTLRLLTAWGASLAYGGLCAAVYLRHRRRQHVAVAPLASPDGAASKPILVAYASQGGQAETLAGQTARALGAAGLPVRLLALNLLRAEDLAAAEQALFIVSTCGEGDAPDNGALFERRLMSEAATPDFPHLHVALLSLGDSSYTHYCGFGRRLAAWLAARGAPWLFAPIETDNGDPEALGDWQHRIAHLAGSGEEPDWRAPAFAPWTLVDRQHLNPGSAGQPVYHLALILPHAPLPTWQAGDLVQVQVPDNGGTAIAAPRDYSIASLPEDGQLHLLVRQQRHPDGRPGLASGWLTEGLPLGSRVSLRLKSHANFRLGDNATWPLILIGNGTGLAGLKALLQAREAQGQGRNWLIYGERHAATDLPYPETLGHWIRSGHLSRVDLAFSRDQAVKVYVQHKLAEAADELRAWVADGAALYVSGSAATMGKAVDDTLAHILGRDALDDLLAAGRYRRDVY